MARVDAFAALRTFLLADATISSAVGAARIFPVKMPQGEIDASIVMTRISSIGDHHNEGATLLARVRYQVDCYALTFGTAADLALAVKARLDGYRGTMSGIVVNGVFMESERDGFEDEANFHRVSQDYIVWHGEGQ